MNGCEQGHTQTGSGIHILTATWKIVTTGHNSCKMDSEVLKCGEKCTIGLTKYRLLIPTTTMLGRSFGFSDEKTGDQCVAYNVRAPKHLVDLGE